MGVGERSDHRQNWHHTDDLHAPQGKGDPFAAAMRSTRMAMVITDPNQPDNPIIFANDAFLKLTGYLREEVIGRNCRFLQGAATAGSDVAAIRDAIAKREDVSVDILNYRKDGQTFWNALYLSPVFNEQGELLYFFASQLDITANKRLTLELSTEKQRFEEAVRSRTVELEQAIEAQRALLHEVDHRVKNNLQLVSSLVQLHANAAQKPEAKAALRVVSDRVDALAQVHKLLQQEHDVRELNLAELVRTLTSGLAHWAPDQSEIQFAVESDDVIVDVETATPIALIINELVTNSLKHAFPHGSGRIVVKVSGDPTDFVVSVADNGVGMPTSGIQGFGTRLTDVLARQLETRVERVSTAQGTETMLNVSKRAAAKGEDNVGSS